MMLCRCTMTSNFFFDDVSGQKSDHAVAKKARELEMDYYRSIGVCSKVPRTEALTNGCKVISTRWIDINKGDDKKPNYRSRVGKEIKKDKRLDLFAATPPLEALKAVVSICASSQYKKKPHRLMSIDVCRAYFKTRLSGWSI